MMMLLLLLLLGQSQDPAAELAQRIQAGQQLLNERKYELALEHFGRLKEEMPEESQAYFYSGMALADSNRIQEAFPEFQRAIELEPDRLEYTLVYSELLARTGQPAEARERLKLFEGQAKIDQLEPREVWLLSDLLYRLQDFEFAKRALERYSEISPPEVRLHFRLAQVYLKTSDWDLAAEYFQKTIGATAEQGPSFFGIGLARFSQKRYAEANEALTRAVELDPKNPDYICLLAATLLAQEDPEQAIGFLDRLADQADRYPRVHYLYAQAYRMTGDQQKAQKHTRGFQLARAGRTPGSASVGHLESVLSEAQSLLARNQVDQARRKFMDALEIDQANWTAHANLTKIYISSGFFNYALQHLTEMQKLNPEAFELQYLMGSYWFERGDLVRSRKYAEQAQRTQPDNADAHNLLGNIHLSLGDRQKAAEEYRIALELAPDRTDIELNYEVASRKPN